ncbi:MAG: hypothetical protein KGY75_05865 [Candidatus Cloacimonetes bacterium]|nr:hypothetical protein [Candidatus Cloacimonadota bacterium]
MRNYRFFTLTVLLLLFVTISQAADLHLEGYLEGNFAARYESESFNWNMWDPEAKVELRFWSNPIQNTDFYMKLYNDKWDADGTHLLNSVAVFSEGHISYQQEKNGLGFKSILFSRENNHYWLDGSMLNLINTGSVDNDKNAQGVRFDFWERWNGSASYVYSDFSGGGGDDVHLLRLRQSFAEEKFQTGLFFLRKNYSDGGKDRYNQVIATDNKIKLSKDYKLNFELASSVVPSDTAITALNENLHNDVENAFENGAIIEGLGDYFKSNFAAQMEFRGLKIGSDSKGYWFITPGFWCYGQGYRNYMGQDTKDEIGFWLDSYYMLPQRAVTLTLNYSRYQKMEDVRYAAGSSRDPVSNLYSELYVEFVNGFDGKIYYNRRQEVWHAEEYNHNDLFAEVSVENKLAKLLTQFKIKDLGEENEKQISGMELSINLSERWRIFTRGMTVNEKSGARMSFFAELLYRFGGNTELYLQYGPDWYGSYGLVNDDNFVAGGNMEKRFKIVLKSWF